MNILTMKTLATTKPNNEIPKHPQNNNKNQMITLTTKNPTFENPNNKNQQQKL